MFWFKNGIIIILICPLSLCLVSLNYEAINSSCVNASYLVNNSSTYQISVPTFSSVAIQVDLRQLASLDDLNGVTLTLNIQNTDTQTNYSEILALNISTNPYNFYAANNIILSAYFTITDKTAALAIGRSYLIGGSMSAYITPPMPASQVQASFLFVVTKKELTCLPYNTINSGLTTKFNGYFLTSIPDDNQMISRQTSPRSYSDYWNGINQIATPYIPYFSNCNDNGDYLNFAQMIHNASECQLYGYSSSPIDKLSFGSSATADTCTIIRTCIYDQTPGASGEYPQWSTLDAQSKYLFSITSNQFPAPYTPVPSSDYTSTQLVPCTLAASGDNTTSKFPMKITMKIGYYQKTASERQIMKCTVSYSLYAPATQNFKYQLEMEFAPMNHTEILLAFGFDWYVYMLVFIMIGLISNLQFIVFYLYHALTSAKKKITLRIMVCIRMLKQIFKGVFLAICIIIFLIFIVQVIMNGTFFGTPLSLTFDSFWNFMVINNIGYFASAKLENIQAARFGLSYIVVSIYLAYQLSHQLVGQQRTSKQNTQYDILGRKFKPLDWNRGKLIFGSFVVALMSSGYLFFTYSTIFNTYIWFFIVSMQVAQMILQQLFYSLYNNILPCLHLKISIGILCYLATMGAIDLYYFVLGYLVDVAISTIQIAYLSQIQQKITNFIEQKNEELHKFYLTLMNEDDDSHQKKSLADNALFNNNQQIILDTILNEVDLLQPEVYEQYNDIDPQRFRSTPKEIQIKRLLVEALEERHKQQQLTQQVLYQSSSERRKEEDKLEREERESVKFQLLVDCCTNMVQYMLQPVVVLILWITYNASNIMNNFNIAIGHSILYLLSSIILSSCFQINIIIIINMLEVYFNYDYNKLIQTLMARFKNKNTFWITDQHINEEQMEGMETKLRGCYKYCLSSQMYFVVSLFSFALYTFVMGFATIISSQYNILKDPIALLIIVFWVSLLQFFKWVLMKLVCFLDIWGYKTHSQHNKHTESKDEYIIDQQTQQILRPDPLCQSQSIFTYQIIAQEAQQRSENVIKSDKKILLQSKLRTICKNLQPTFQKQDFRLQYAIKNKDFIRKNIQKILPLIKSFPENDSNWLGKTSSQHIHKMKKQTKNVDPMIGDFISTWLKRVEANKQKRNKDGIQRERRLKKCSFCFKTWAVYYGYDGMCLECSKQLLSCQDRPKQD